MNSIMYDNGNYNPYDGPAIPYQMCQSHYGCFDTPPSIGDGYFRGYDYISNEEKLRHLLYWPQQMSYPPFADNVCMPPSESSTSESFLKPDLSKHAKIKNQHRSPVLENCSSGSRSKRRPYTRYQLTVLESEYITNEYITRQKRWDIACKLNLSERQIKVWFQNRRMKKKKNGDRDSTLM